MGVAGPFWKIKVLEVPHCTSKPFLRELVTSH